MVRTGQDLNLWLQDGTHRRIYFLTSTKLFFFKYGSNKASFCLFSYFSQCNDKYSPMFDFKSKDGVLGIRTRDRRMVGTDESTELCPPSYSVSPYFNVMYSSIANNIGKKSYKQIWRNFATWATCQMV